MKYSSIAGFHGGIHPTDGTDKELSKDIPIRVYSPKAVWISMKQSAGSGCQITVQKGDKVTKGQLIGIPTRFGSANIHASISGTVMDIMTMKDPQDNEEQYVIIQAETMSEQQMEEDEAKSIPSHHKGFIDISSYTKEDIITSMKEGGLIGMGGAGFPTHVKYETTNPIDYVLINAAECEPYLTCDHRLMMEYGYDIMNGIQLFLKAAGARKAFICMEDNKKDAAEHLSNLLLKSDLPIEVILLGTKYPQGGERQLIEAVIGKEVPAGKLPADIGVIINNVGTAKALADLIFTKTP
ncbi:MAG: RnfABCDGE type electron transport complex subunit C, partial [Clostridiales bacterium]|nr:RnfABCDGE type electron transport complex subunit C [Clostridiales bacterium]